MSQGAYITNSCQIHKYKYSSTNRHCTERKKKLFANPFKCFDTVGRASGQTRTNKTRQGQDRQTDKGADDSNVTLTCRQLLTAADAGGNVEITFLTVVRYSAATVHFRSILFTGD